MNLRRAASNIVILYLFQKITSYFPKVNRPIDEKTNNGTKRESTMNNVTEDGAAHAGLHGMELLAKSCKFVTVNYISFSTLTTVKKYIDS